MGTESFSNNVLVGIKRQVTHEEGVRGRVTGITILLGTVVGAISRCGVGARGSQVDVGSTAVDLGTLLSIQGSGGIGRVGKLDISIALRTARISVSYDTGTDKLTKFLKLAVQPLVVDVPAQVANKEVLDPSVFVNLRLFGRCSRLLFSLALLGRFLSFFLAGVV
jgi:hypothetical protein